MNKKLFTGLIVLMGGDFHFRDYCRSAGLDEPGRQGKK